VCSSRRIVACTGSGASRSIFRSAYLGKREDQPKNDKIIQRKEFLAGSFDLQQDPIEETDLSLYLPHAPLALCLDEEPEGFKP
jgi:hypothetical protein